MTGTLILPEWLIGSPGVPPKQGWGVRVWSVTGLMLSLRTTNCGGCIPPTRSGMRPDKCLRPVSWMRTRISTALWRTAFPLDKAPSGFWPFLVDFWWPLVEDQLDHEMICAATT